MLAATNSNPKQKKYEFLEETSLITSEFYNLSLNKSEKDINNSVNYILNQLNNFEADKVIKSKRFTQCEFICTKPHTYLTDGMTQNRSERCANRVVSKSGNKFCQNHKFSYQAKKVKLVKDQVKLEYNEYYKDPSKELELLYGNDIYYDRFNTIVQRNPDLKSNIKWIIICKSKVDTIGNRILFKLTQTKVDKFNNDRKKYNYNYTLNTDLFQKIRLEYSNSLELDNGTSSELENESYFNSSPSELIEDEGYWECPYMIYRAGTQDCIYDKINYRLQQCALEMSFKDLLNESEYEEHFD